MSSRAKDRTPPLAPMELISMTRFVALALCLLPPYLPASAQVVAPSTAASISGTVVNEPGDHPVKKVIVQVLGEPPLQGANYSAITDADGHFHLENVRAGHYRVFFEKTGLVEVNSRGQKADVNVITVAAGKSADDLLFRMEPTAVITGRIVDEDGDPMPGVRVLAQRKIPGKAKRETVSVAATDDLGVYRLPGLFPGQYWVAAMPPPDFRDYLRPKDKSGASANPPETRYLATYYPGTNDGSEASAVTLKAGDEMPVSLMLIPARTYRVRGIVTGIASGESLIVELTSKTGDSIRAIEVGTDGQFEVQGAAPGPYVLRATTGSDSAKRVASQDITVVAADVEGVKLAPLPSFTLSGHLRLVDDPSGSSSIYTVNLRQADVSDDSGFFMSEETFGENAQVDRQGYFSWKNVNAGTYIVRLYGGNGKDSFFLKSARIGDRDIQSGFTASGPATLELAISTKSGTVEGLVTDRDKQGHDQPVSNVSVVAVPDEKYRKIPERFGSGATDQFGHFAIHGLAPGSYTLFAWQDVDDNLFRDSDFLQSQQANGVPLTVEEGSSQSIELKLSPISDDWR